MPDKMRPQERSSRSKREPVTDDVEQKLRDALYKANTDLNRIVNERDRANNEADKLRKRADDLAARLASAVAARDDLHEKHEQAKVNYNALNDNWLRRYVDLETRYNALVKAREASASAAAGQASPPTSATSINNDSGSNSGSTPSKKKHSGSASASKDDRGRGRDRATSRARRDLEREREREREKEEEREAAAERERLSRRFEEKKRPPMVQTGSSGAKGASSKHRGVSVNQSPHHHRSASAKPLGRTFSGSAGHIQVTPGVSAGGGAPTGLGAGAGSGSSSAKRASQQYYVPRTPNPGHHPYGGSGAHHPTYVMSSEAGGNSSVHSDGAYDHRSGQRVSYYS